MITSHQREKMNMIDQPAKRPDIEWCGKKHVDMTREELMDFVEALDWGIGDLNKRLGDPAPAPCPA